MLDSFIKFIIKESLHEKNERTLLGVSGGLDSMVMTDLYQKAGFEIGIAHCNFKLRGQESDNDEHFVSQYAKKHKLPVYSIQCETKQHAANLNSSIQMVARDLRMNWFLEVLAREGYHSVATAHHGDDQVETFFINLLRGTGISGLRGIMPRSGKLIHPLLFTNRKEIHAYAKANDISYREDSSNLKTDYVRNKIRHVIIPELEKIKPGFPRVLSSNMDHLRSTEQVLKTYFKDTWETLAKEEEGIIKINLGKLRKIKELPTHLFEFLKDFGFNSTDASRIAASIDSLPGKQFFSKTHRIVLDRNFLLLEKMKESDNRNEFFIGEKDEIILIPIELSFLRYEKEEHLTIINNPKMAQLDADKIKYPIIIRKWRTGDQFHPLGMKGSKLISDFFIDNKFSRIEKENTWLLTSGGDIVWIIGFRIDDRFKILPTTQRILEIKYSS